MTHNIKKEKRNIVDFFIITLFIYLVAGASTVLENNIFFIVISLLLYFIFYLRRCKVDKVVIIVSIIWIFINSMSFFINDINDFLYNPFLGYLLRIFISYFIIKIVGDLFWEKFYRYTYVLTIISLFLFEFQQIETRKIY